MSRHKQQHHKPGHDQPKGDSRSGPIGMVAERSTIATFLAYGLVGFVILAILVVVLRVIFG